MGHAHPIHSFKAAAKSAEIVIVMNSRCRPCAALNVAVDIRGENDRGACANRGQAGSYIGRGREGERHGKLVSS